MLTSRQKQMLQEIPKAENHIHIEGSIPWALALELAEKNHVKLPVHSTEEIAVWSQDLISRKGLDGFMICDRTLNSVCLHEEDYEAVVLALANGVRIFWVYKNLSMAVVVATSLVVTIVIAKLVGCVLPILAKRLHMDPAIMASPLITTIVDTCSIVIYFQIATLMFHIS